MILVETLGKEATFQAGFKESNGDYVVFMVADLQDPPYLLPEMVNALTLGNYDSVATYCIDRKGEPKIKSFFARNFYKFISRISDVDIVDGARNHRMMKRSMVDAILSLNEYYHFSKGIVARVDFKTKLLPFESEERVVGETKWSLWKLFEYAIKDIVVLATVPFRISILFGLIVFILAFLCMIYVFIKAKFFGDLVAGYTSMIVIILFLGSIQLLSIGVLGEFVSKTYMEIKYRPITSLRNNTKMIYSSFLQEVL